MSIRQISAEQTYIIRQPILRPGKPIQACQFGNDFDADVAHFGAYKQDQLVGIVSVYPQSCPVQSYHDAWQVRAMATLPDVRGQGYGWQLLDAISQYVTQHQGNVLWCNARIIAIGFYEKYGFIKQSEVFNIADIGEHYVMVKIL